MKLASCVIPDETGKILLLHRNTNVKRHWEVPGGKVEEGETNADAAIREAREELGVDVELIRELGHRAFHEDDFDIEYMWFLARVINGEPTVAEPDIFDDLQYFSLQEMANVRLSTGAWNFLALIKEEKLTLVN